MYKTKKITFLLIYISILYIFSIKGNNISNYNFLNQNLLYNNISYILKIKFPDNIAKIPDVWLYYKGYKIDFEQDICLIRQFDAINNLILLVTPEVNHKFEGNNIKYLERIENKPCRMFYITKNIKDWDIEEENINNIPIRIPENAMVILMNPNYIESLKNINYDNPPNTNRIIINLPKIVLKKNIKEEELLKSMNYIYLAAFDSDAIHTKAKKLSKEKNEVLTSINILER